MKRLGLIGIAAVMCQAAASAPVLVNTYTVTNTDDSGDGSLRDAIMKADSDLADSTIHFDLPASGEFVIRPLSALPALVDHTLIVAEDTNADGSPRVILDGASAETTAVGLHLAGGNDLVRGLTLRQWGAGCLLITAPRCTVQGCHLSAGTAQPVLTRRGIVIQNAAEAHIGGSDPSDRNVIGGNAENGIVVMGTSNATLIRGNYIGTDWSGMHEDPNGMGIYVRDGLTGTVIGGSGSAERNVISGNDLGVFLESTTTVRGNLIGVAADGLTPLGNNQGIEVEAPSCIIGGDNPLLAGQGPDLGEGNVVAGNRDYQIDAGSDNTVILGNFIGVAADGRHSLAPQGVGVQISNAANTTLGSTVSGEGNIIAGCDAGVFIREAGSMSSGVVANRIGVNLFGEVLGNDGFGILDFDGSFNTIGGPTPAHGNVIAGSGMAGVAVIGEANNVLISHNAIFDSALLGIDLGSDGVTPNDDLDSDVGPNLQQNFPVVTEADLDGATPRVAGSLHSQAQTLYNIEVYLNSVPGSPEFGEGQFFVADTTCTTDAAGAASWEATLPGSPAEGRYLAALAIGPATNTSEFGPSLKVAGRDPTPEELIEALLGLIPVLDEYERNGDDPFDAADLVTLINPPTAAPN